MKKSQTEKQRKANLGEIQRALRPENVKKLYLKWGLEPLSWMHYFFPQYFFKKSPPFHREIAHNFYHLPQRIQAYEATRGFAKSTLAEFLVFHTAIFKSTRFIMFISLTEEIASDRIVDIRNECDSNDKLRAFFGDLKTDKWGEKEIIIRNDQLNIHCKVLARGLGQQILGIKYLYQRPQLVIVDDPEDIKIAENPENVNKDERWFTKEVEPALSDDGRIFVISTPVTADCLIERVKDYKGVYFKRYSAEDRRPDGKLLWEEHMNFKNLMAKKEELSSRGQLHVYYTEYLCNPLPPDRHPFKEEMFEYFVPKDIDHKKLNIFFLIDLAIGEKKRHAYSALVVIGVDETDTWWVLDTFQVKEDPYLFAKDIYGFRDKWDPLDIGVELAALQGIFWSVLQLTAEKHGWKPIYAQGIVPIQDKDTRGRKLIPRFRVKKIKFRRDQKEAKEQLILFPDYRFRDFVDCLSMGEDFCYARGAEKPKEKEAESWRQMKADTDEELLKEEEDAEERKLKLEDEWDMEDLEE